MPTSTRSACCVLSVLLTGQVPFPREGDEARLWAHLPERPPRVGGGVPGAFDAVVARALAKAPDARYPSAGDLGRAAVAAAAGRRVRRPERAVASGIAAAAELPTRPSAPAPRRRRRRVAALLALAGAAAAAVAVPALESDRERPPPERDIGPAREAAGPSPRVTRVPVGRRPNTLVRAGGRIWVGSFGSPALDVVEPDTGRRMRGVRPAVGDGTTDIAVARGRLWVGRAAAGSSCSTRAPAGRSDRRSRSRSSRSRSPPAATTSWPRVESDDGGVLFAQLIRFDADTRTVEASTEVMYGTAGALYARGWLWTLHGEPNYIVRRDPVTLRARQRIKLPGSMVGTLA